jgi:hypothetical protein
MSLLARAKPEALPDNGGTDCDCVQDPVEQNLPAARLAHSRPGRGLNTVPQMTVFNRHSSRDRDLSLTLQGVERANA